MHKLEWLPEGVYWKYYGDVTGKEIISASKKIYGDPRFDQLKFKLVDFRDAESVQIDKNEVAEIAFQHKAAALSKHNIKNAIVVNNSDNKMATLFASFFNDTSWEVKIFQDMNEAQNWIGKTKFI